MGCYVSKTKYKLIEQQLEEAKNKNRQVYTNLNAQINELSKQIQQLTLSEYQKGLEGEDLSKQIQKYREMVKEMNEKIKILETENQIYLTRSRKSEEELQQSTQRWAKENQILIEKYKNYDSLILKYQGEIEIAEIQLQTARGEAQSAINEAQKANLQVEQVRKAEDNYNQLEEKINILINAKQNIEMEKQNLIHQISQLQQENLKLSQYVSSLQGCTLGRQMSTQDIIQDYKLPPNIEIVQSTYESNGQNLQKIPEKDQE